MLLQKDDYFDVITPEGLEQVTGGDDSLRLRAETAAIAELNGYLSGLYDTSLLFQQLAYPEPGEPIEVDGVLSFPFSVPSLTRRQDLITCLCDLALYRLFSRISYDQTPEIRRIRYKDAMRWIEKVISGEIKLSLPHPPDTQIEDFTFKSGGNPRRNNYF